MDGYSKTQITLHWAVAILIGLQFMFAEGMSEAFEAVEHGGAVETEYGENEYEHSHDDEEGAVRAADTAGFGAALTPGAAVHIGIGAAVFALALWRLGLRRSHGAPSPPLEDPAWQRHVARSVHYGLYVLLLALPVAGAVGWFAGSEAAAEFHEVLGTIMLGVIGLHVLGALYGEFVQSTGVLGRMINPNR